MNSQTWRRTTVVLGQTVEFHKIHFDSTKNTSANLTFVRNIFVLTKLNDESEIENTDEGNFVTYRLQDAILPWPLNCLHIIPDWLIFTA